MSRWLHCSNGATFKKVYPAEHARGYPEWSIVTASPPELRRNPDGSITTWRPDHPLYAATEWPGRHCWVEHDRAFNSSLLTCGWSEHWHEQRDRNPGVFRYDAAQDAPVARWHLRAGRAPHDSERSHMVTSNATLAAWHGNATLCDGCLAEGTAAVIDYYGCGCAKTLYSNGTNVTVEADGTMRTVALGSDEAGDCLSGRRVLYPNGDQFGEVKTAASAVVLPRPVGWVDGDQPTTSAVPLPTGGAVAVRGGDRVRPAS